MRILTSGRNCRNVRASRPPPTGSLEGQPIRPLAVWCNKYCWTHGKSRDESIVKTKLLDIRTMRLKNWEGELSVVNEGVGE